MTLILYVFALVLSSALRVCVSDSNTVLAIKRGVENHSIAIGATTYLELVKKSTIFVDNTLFIDELLKSERKFDVILCPRKWGRTMLLDMLKTFLEIHVDDSGVRADLQSTRAYKLFKHGVIIADHGNEEKLEKPLLIAAKKNIMDEYQGQYPVIYVNFKDVIGGNFDEIIQRLRIKVSDVFNQHKYLLYVLQKQKLIEDASNFERLLYPNATSSASECALSLNFLCKILHNHFKKRVFVLIDDYDAPFQSLLHHDKLDERIFGQLQNVFNSLLMSTLMNNYNLERGIVIGAFEIQINDIEFQNRFHYQRAVFKNQTMLQFFGFSRTDVESLFKNFNITGDLFRLALKWYYGHQSLLDNKDFYNPWSVVNFLMHKRVVNYYLNNENLDFLKGPIKRSSLMRQYILSLMGNQIVTCRSVMRMNKCSIMSLRNILQCKNANPNKKADVFLVFRYLIGTGFLMIRRYDFGDQVRIPNKEVASIFAFRLKSYYQQTYNIDQKSLHEAGLDFYQYLQDTLYYPSINEMLENLYGNNRNFTNFNTLNGTVENPVYPIFNLLLLEVQCVTKFDHEVDYDRIRSKSIYVIHDDTAARGAIIMIYTGDLNYFMEGRTLELARYYRRKVFERDIKTVKFIGINFQSNGAIVVKAYRKKLRKAIYSCDPYENI